jgi:hypothetical protein
MHYTGIGSRDTPKDIYPTLAALAKTLASTHILRSGGARGADDAFEKGCLEAKGRMEIYLPWDGFNGRHYDNVSYLDATKEAKEAEKIAAEFHPVWDTLKETARLFHTRNVHQVLGQDLKTPSQFVVCYSLPNAFRSDFVGGTGQALRIAKAYNLPTFNLANPKQTDQLAEFIRQLFIASH